MRTPDGSDAEMDFRSRFLPRRAARRSSDEAIAERLLACEDAGPGASPAQHALALTLLAAARPGTERELSGEAAAVAAFVRVAAASGTHAKPRTAPGARRAPVLAAGIMATVVVALCGTAVAGALPGPLQRIAHTTFGAPAPGHPGHPVPAVGASTASTGASPILTTASHPAASPGGTAMTSGNSASAPGKVKKTTATPSSLATTPGSSATATSTPSNNGNGNGNGKGHGKG